MSTLLSDEANERLQALWRAKLVEAVAALAKCVTSPVPDDERAATRRRMSITRWSNKVDELRRQVGA